MLSIEILPHEETSDFQVQQNVETRGDKFVITKPRGKPDQPDRQKNVCEFTRTRSRLDKIREVA